MQRPPSGTIVHLDCKGCENKDDCALPLEWHWEVDPRQPHDSDTTYVTRIDKGTKKEDFEYSCPTAQLRLAQKLIVVGNELRMEEV